MTSTSILVLTLARAPAGTRATVEFRERGGSIGRSEDCDWVLAAPGISRTHAAIRHLNGLYFIEDRSTNGMLLNGAPLSRGEPASLSDGDRLQLDSFEIEVSLRADAPSATSSATPALQAPPSPHEPAHPPPPAPPSPPSPPSPSPAPAPWAAAPVSGNAAVDDLLAGLGARPEATVDPLQLFDAPPASPPPPRADAGWDHGPPAADHFRAPRPAATPAMLPERWDLTIGDFSAPARAPAPAAAGPGGASAADPLLGLFPAGDGAWADTPAPAAGAQAPVAPAAPDAVWPGSVAAHDAPTPAPAPAPTPTPAPAPAPGGAAAPVPDLDRIFAIVVDGVMEVLRARAEIKNTFRLPVTIIQRSENNPLKFAATPEEAMRRLMHPDGAFLSGADAFDDAFDDIRCHQMAMLAGMRAAFESLLAHFNPDRLEREVDAAGRRTFAGKGRYWERYREDFAAAAKDPDACFRMLFGDEFARAYEAQLARLKSARRAGMRG